MCLFSPPMISRRFRKDFSELPRYHKILALGAFLGCLGVFLPWYREFDNYFGSRHFLGITGPLYFIGLTLFFLNLSLVLSTIFLVKQKPFWKFPIHGWHFPLATGIFSLYLVILSNTIYFHPLFGLSLLSKETMFGMIVSSFAGILLTFGAFMQKKAGSVNEFHLESSQEETSKRVYQPLIDISQSPRRPQFSELKKSETVEEAENLRMDL